MPPKSHGVMHVLHNLGDPSLDTRAPGTSNEVTLYHRSGEKSGMVAGRRLGFCVFSLCLKAMVAPLWLLFRLESLGLRGVF